MWSSFVYVRHCLDCWRIVGFWLARCLRLTDRVKPWYLSGPVDSLNFQDWPISVSCFLFSSKIQNKSNVQSQYPGLVSCSLDMLIFYPVFSHPRPEFHCSISIISLVIEVLQSSESSSFSGSISSVAIPISRWQSRQDILWLGFLLATLF